MAKLSPSVLSADFLTLDKYLRIFEKCGVDMVHMDVMDGLFVPNISFGAPLIKAVKNHTNIPIDTHLMIDRPDRYLDSFASCSDSLGFHFEAGSDVEKLLADIKAKGIKTCLTIKPGTDEKEIYPFLPLCDMALVMSVEPGFGGQKFMPGSLRKIENIKSEIVKKGLATEIEIDGGINGETAKSAVLAGADVLVVGSYIFNSPNAEETVLELKAL